MLWRTHKLGQGGLLGNTSEAGKNAGRRQVGVRE